MRCEKCGDALPRRVSYGQWEYLELSHDVPCYLIHDKKTRKEREKIADTYPRHYLCKRCHASYEFGLNIHLKKEALKYAKYFFKE